MKIEPYLFFEGRCDEAIEFYRDALAAEVTALMRYKDNPDRDSSRPGTEDKIMHANLRIGETTVMVSDGLCSGHPNFQGFSLTLSLASEAQASRMFQALAEGGKIRMPLAQTFYSPLFGMVVDRFGVQWMILVTV
jgi:PhnB protein